MKFFVLNMKNENERGIYEFIPNFPKSTKNLLFWMVLRESFVIFITRSDMDLNYESVMNLHPSR